MGYYLRNQKSLRKEILFLVKSYLNIEKLFLYKPTLWLKKLEFKKIYVEKSINFDLDCNIDVGKRI